MRACELVTGRSSLVTPIILTQYSLLILTQCKHVIRKLSYTKRKEKLYD